MLIIAVIFFLATVLYMAFTYQSLPPMMPMQWNGRNIPTWYATRETFIVWMFVFLIGLNVVLWLASRRKPPLASMLVLFNAIELFKFHMIYQQVAPQKFLFVPVNVGTIIIVATAFIGVAVLLLRMRARQENG